MISNTDFVGFFSSRLDSETKRVGEIFDIFNRLYGAEFEHADLQFNVTIKAAVSAGDDRKLRTELERYARETKRAAQIVRVAANSLQTTIAMMSSNYSIWDEVIASSRKLEGYSRQDSLVLSRGINSQLIVELRDGLIGQLGKIHREMNEQLGLIEQQGALFDEILSNKVSFIDGVGLLRQANELFIREKENYIQIITLMEFDSLPIARLNELKALGKYYLHNLRHILREMARDFKGKERKEQLTDVARCLLIASAFLVFVYRLKNKAAAGGIKYTIRKFNSWLGAGSASLWSQIYQLNIGYLSEAIT